MEVRNSMTVTYSLIDPILRYDDVSEAQWPVAVNVSCGIFCIPIRFLVGFAL